MYVMTDLVSHIICLRTTPNDNQTLSRSGGVRKCLFKFIQLGYSRYSFLAIN